MVEYFALKNQAQIKKMKLHLQNCSSWSISHSWLYVKNISKYVEGLQRSPSIRQASRPSKEQSHNRRPMKNMKLAYSLSTIRHKQLNCVTICLKLFQHYLENVYFIVFTRLFIIFSCICSYFELNKYKRTARKK